jgi:leucine dehydrogenase
MTLIIEDVTSRFATHPEFDHHERIIRGEDKSIGFLAFIAVHNTHNGVALGGCRYRSNYNDENAALTDVLRLSRGMTYKNALAGLPLGGGKTVIMGKMGTRSPTPDMMQALGKMLESPQMAHSYVTAEDMGTSVELMLIVRGQSTMVAGLPLETAARHLMPTSIAPKDIPGGDPSPYTAWGTFQGIRAALRQRFGHDNMDGMHATIKGYGNVSAILCKHLQAAGAKMTIAEIDPERRMAIASTYGEQALLPDGAEIMAHPADIYIPCAAGGDINDKTIPMLKTAGVQVIAGCANNQLAEARHGDALHDAGILYAPDYVINAGGVIALGIEYVWMQNAGTMTFPTSEAVMQRVSKIGDVMGEILARAAKEGKSPALVADTMARERFVADGKSNGASKKAA